MQIFLSAIIYGLIKLICDIDPVTYASLCMQIFLSAIIYGLIKLICDIDTLHFYMYSEIYMDIYIYPYISYKWRLCQDASLGGTNCLGVESG